MAPNRQLVAVGKHAGAHLLTAKKHSVAAALVHHPHLVTPPDDHRVASRDGRVLEADVGVQTPPDTNDIAIHSTYDRLAVEILVDEVAAGLRDAGTSRPSDSLTSERDEVSGARTAIGSVRESSASVCAMC